MTNCGGTPGQPRRIRYYDDGPGAIHTGLCPGCPDCRPCERCGGMGFVGKRPVACPRCEGIGVEPRFADQLQAQRHGLTNLTNPPPPARESTGTITLTLTREEWRAIRDQVDMGYWLEGGVTERAVAKLDTALGDSSLRSDESLLNSGRGK